MKYSLFFLSLLMFSWLANAQRKPMISEEDENKQSGYFNYPEPEKKERYKIAVLTPLYLDSVDLEKNLTRIPKFMMPGIDFYQGVSIAADTLKNQGVKFDLYIYDSKSDYLNVKNLIAYFTTTSYFAYRKNAL
ncbi:MAG: hypothetical protein IPG85_05940 [Bacteroidetes bacterium]|nr:hypothetical protein [Bacteroidota bacterium]